MRRRREAMAAGGAGRRRTPDACAYRPCSTQAGTDAAGLVETMEALSSRDSARLWTALEQRLVRLVPAADASLVPVRARRV